MHEAKVPQKRIITDFPYKVKNIEHVWIPMSDGTRLSARIWMPEIKEGEKVPAVFEYLPYRKRDGVRGRDEPIHSFFAGNGYASIRVDQRGSGESEGFLRDEYLKQEQDDAVDVIDWLSRQPWCTGSVGMMGKSWGGHNSLQVAARRPEALKAIIVVAFTDDRYNNCVHYKGGCLLNDNMWWGTIMLAYQSRPGDPALIGDEQRETWLKRMEEMPLWPAVWMNHQTRDDYWKHGSICEDWSAIQCPVLAFGGWADGYTNSVLRIMEGLQVPRRGVIGPWAHLFPQDGTPAPAIGYLQEGLRWWDRWLKGIDNGTMDDPMIQVWVEDSQAPSSIFPVSKGRWVSMDSWPSPDSQIVPWHLTYGKLSNTPQKKPETLEVCTPQNHCLLAGEWMQIGVSGESPSDQRLDDGMARVFDSEVLSEPLEILGYPRFEVELSSDKPSAILYARLSDVAPDGAVTRVSYGLLNLTHAQGHDKVVPLEPGKKQKVSVELEVAGHRFAAGHRVRLSLATTCWPMFWPMPEEATLTLDLQTAKLDLPLFRGPDCKGPIEEPQSGPDAPVTVLKPGRVDRTLHYDILTDTWTYIKDAIGGAFGEGILRYDEIDSTVEHNLKEERILKNGDPLSARYNLYQTYKMGREGWWIEMDTKSSLHGDATHFFVSAEHTVKENGVEIFNKTWNEKIPRQGL